MWVGDISKPLNIMEISTFYFQGLSGKCTAVMCFSSPDGLAIFEMEIFLFVSYQVYQQKYLYHYSHYSKLGIENVWYRSLKYSEHSAWILRFGFLHVPLGETFAASKTSTVSEEHPFVHPKRLLLPHTVKISNTYLTKYQFQAFLSLSKYMETTREK